MSITPEFNGDKVNATYFGQSTKDSRNTGNLNNAAVVIYNQLTKPRGADKTKGWLSVNYGAGYSRTNNFYENISYGGTNNTSSIGNYFADLANGSVQSDAQGFYLPEGSLQSWAYNHFLTDEANGIYTSNAAAGGSQLVNISRTGGLSQFDFSLGANYSNKFYIGLGLGFTDLRFNSSSLFRESGTASLPATSTEPTEPNLPFNTQYAQEQATRGTGFNARLGIIYKPVEAVRLGATFTSPTWYNIDDLYSEGLSTQFPQSTTGSSFTDQNDQPYSLNYNLRTPYKVSGGIAVFIKQFGFISGDIDYIDYTSTHIGDNGNYDNTRDNNDIKTLYKSAVNARVGAEARISSNFLLRGGYGVQGDYRKENGSDIKTASGGIGLRFGSYYVDATYLHITGNQTVFPYEAGAVSPGALLNRSANNGYLTLGYRF